MSEIIKLIRVKQWVKNMFLFVPAFFAGKLSTLPLLEHLFIGLFSFSFIASSIYIINDYVDIENDRQHPEKCNRPLAAGTVKTSTAWIVFALLFTASIGLALMISKWFLAIILFYFLMNLGYSIKLKQYSILDVIIIASGFLLRVIAGGIIVDVIVSKWLFLMTFLLALILAFAKRRDDILVKEKGKLVRKSIEGYNLNFIDISMVFLATVTVVSYIMYTISDEIVIQFGNDYIYASVFFVIIGLLRYFQLSFVYNKSGKPTKLLYSDKVLKAAILAWILFFAVIIYWI